MINYITEKSGYFKLQNNIGFHKVSETEIILIDVGLESCDCDSFIKMLLELRLKPIAILLTHCHSDHVKGVNRIREFFKAQVCAPKHESTFIESADLYSLFLYPNPSLKSVNSSYHDNTLVDIEHDSTQFKFSNSTIKIIKLPGHSYNSVGYLTNDGVLFSGDTIIEKELLLKLKFLYVFNLKEHIESIYTLLFKGYNCLIPSHGNIIFDIKKNINENILYWHNYLNQITNHLHHKLTMGQLIQRMSQSKGNCKSLDKFFTIHASLHGTLAYLLNENLIKLELIDNELYYESIPNRKINLTHNTD